MALTRKFLKALGLTDEQVESIVDAHAETVDALKVERDTAKAEAEKSADLQKRLNEAEKKLNEMPDAKRIQDAFDAYKAEVETDKLNRAKGSALDGILTEIGIKRDSFRNAVKKAYDLTKLELDKDGAIKGKEGVIDAIKNEYSDFIGEVSKEGLSGGNPPSGNSAGMSKDKIMQIKDATARQKAIAENIELFKQ